MSQLVEHPVGIVVLRRYLLTVPLVTGFFGSRVSTEMPRSDVSPRWPAVRLTEITSNELIPKVWVRMLFQADVWGSTQGQADRGARVLLGAITAIDNYTDSDAVMGNPEDLTVRSAPDPSLNEAQPRAIVTGHVWIRPN